MKAASPKISRRNSRCSGSQSRTKMRKYALRGWKLRAERVARGKVEYSDDLVKIDVDPGQAVYSLAHMKRLLARAGQGLVRRWKVRSGSGKGWHVYVVIYPGVNSPMEMVALQAVLGSDRYREACNVQRARTLETMTPEMREYWADRFNVLYDGGWDHG